MLPLSSALYYNITKISLGSQVADIKVEYDHIDQIASYKTNVTQFGKHEYNCIATITCLSEGIS